MPSVLKSIAPLIYPCYCLFHHYGTEQEYEVPMVPFAPYSAIMSVMNFLSSFFFPLVLTSKHGTVYSVGATASPTCQHQ